MVQFTLSFPSVTDESVLVYLIHKQTQSPTERYLTMKRAPPLVSLDYPTPALSELKRGETRYPPQPMPPSLPAPQARIADWSRPQEADSMDGTPAIQRRAHNTESRAPADRRSCRTSFG
jgi:hypothetical protein